MRHDPQRFMGKTVTVPHFNRDTVEFASRKRTQRKTREPEPSLPPPKEKESSYGGALSDKNGCEGD